MDDFDAITSFRDQMDILNDMQVYINKRKDKLTDELKQLEAPYKEDIASLPELNRVPQKRKPMSDNQDEPDTEPCDFCGDAALEEHFYQQKDKGLWCDGAPIDDEEPACVCGNPKCGMTITHQREEDHGFPHYECRSPKPCKCENCK
jgi:hypothetical protein